MKFQEFKSLNIGDIVTPYRGKLKGKPAKVTGIWYTPHLEYPGTYVDFEFLDPEIEKVHMDNIYTGVLDYRALKLIEHKGD